MEPYATASEAGPLNGNRPPVNGNDSFFTQYRSEILYSIAGVIIILIGAIILRRKVSGYKSGKKEKSKKSRSVWTKAAATLEKSKKSEKSRKSEKSKKSKKGPRVYSRRTKPISQPRCPKGCVPTPVVDKKKENMENTSFDPALTDKKPKVQGTRQ
jgi:hypothetical protein|tara:strand:+ start:3516 stop:3983 length:468 start_codon:yes stop_codon:yes gene_type:complete